MNLFDLKGKTAIVTGSSRGIGRAIAETLAEAGARVVISSRKGEACETVAAAIRERGGEATAIACNVAEKAELAALVEHTRATFGPADIVVCNAGVNPFFGRLADLPDTALDRVLNVNLRSVLWLAQMVLPEMAARQDGALVIVSSIAGLRASTNLGAYGISKAADMQLARSLAQEWGPHNVRINCIAPGLIRTDFSRALWEDDARLEARLATTPLRRLGEPEDIAGVALMLASPAGRYITGQTITVDGGVTIA